MYMVINKTNQSLDFDETHIINEYKSAYVLRCRSTIISVFISDFNLICFYNIHDAFISLDNFEYHKILIK